MDIQNISDSPYAWILEDQYQDTTALPAELHYLGGPGAASSAGHGGKGVIPDLVQVYTNGRTTPGWGPANYMQSRNNSAFSPYGIISRYQNNHRPFAILMRSMPVICVDIDAHVGQGGANGFDHLAKLGPLPPTLAETSKSGQGRHLFYLVDDEWDSKFGFNRYQDVIGLVPGVDIRAVGCVYHYETQQWNSREIVKAPQSLLDLLDSKVAAKTQRKLDLQHAAANPDSDEALILHDQLLTELNKPINAGKRNITLFALGSQMYEAGYPDWQEEIYRRGTELGLDVDELEKIVRNAGLFKP